MRRRSRRNHAEAHGFAREDGAVACRWSLRAGKIAAATQRANELGAKVDAVLKELRHATKKSGWGQLTQ